MKYQAPYGSTDPDAGYVDRDTPSATAGSRVPAPAIEDPQRELAALIAAAGLTPSDLDLKQVAKAIQSRKLNNVGTFGGTANALTGTLALAPTSYAVGLYVEGIIATTNTGPVTINVNGLGAKPVTNSGAALVGGELPAGTVQGFVYDGASMQISAAKGSGRLINRQVFSTAGAYTYTPTPGTRSVLVEVQAGGAGGGGTVSTSSGAFASAGGGGAAGGYASSYLSSGFSGQTVTVGAGGAAAPGANGGVGGSSSFGSLLSATGGSQGTVGGNTAVASTTQAFGGAVGGVGSGGNLVNSAGGNGRFALLSTQPLSGEGGSSRFGGGGYNRSSTSAGLAGPSPGSGGSGASSLNGNTGGVTGGAGADGIVIIWEYA